VSGSGVLHMSAPMLHCASVPFSVIPAGIEHQQLTLCSLLAQLQRWGKRCARKVHVGRRHDNVLCSVVARDWRALRDTATEAADAGWLAVVCVYVVAVERGIQPVRAPGS